MSARVTAGRLAHVDIGKTITAPTAGASLTGTLMELTVREHLVGLDLRIGGGTFTIPLDPQQLITITGKEQSR